MGKFKEDLGLALELAGHADVVTMHRFEATDLSVKEKPDLTPVSDADLNCEKHIRDSLKRSRPRDEVLGEEFGGQACYEGRQWVIDPIDGTKNFVRGVPVWATLISLLEDGEPVVSVVSAPALRRRWYAAKGAGAYRVFGGEPKRLHVSQIEKLGHASLAMSSLTGWSERGLRDKFLNLTDKTWRLRGYGDFWSYCLVAEGAVDIATEPEVSLWDLAAPSLLVTEAGGTFTDLSGTPGPHGGSAIASNGRLHKAALQMLQD
ncbi:histidinol-phosphatase [Corynebacterium accolens]|uniref:histidinol-phosphatase n=1 Tax=Corynebacterium accolens TaxID=38284 RepID=UPI0026700576|nr:histidinol-phosphatase [Corynebacterium accolens]WKS70071.1 histidinol-phosphatase [Corynebacterium accolens]WKS70399.1 histidinol-phosphatase [Corynebacterium accolens]WKS74540.1 histidinol-phosphatase [Corynebacterium accolens]